MLISNVGCQTPREQKGKVEYLFLENIIIIMIKCIINMLPEGGKKKSPWGKEVEK